MRFYFNFPVSFHRHRPYILQSVNGFPRSRTVYQRRQQRTIAWEREKGNGKKAQKNNQTLFMRRPSLTHNNISLSLFMSSSSHSSYGRVKEKAAVVAAVDNKIMNGSECTEQTRL